MATPSPQGFLVFSYSPPGRTERMQEPARLLMSPSSCTLSINCPFRASSCSVPNSQHCFSSLRTRALDSLSAPLGVSECSSLEVHSSIILERSLRKDGKTSSRKNIENQRRTVVRAGQGDSLGNNNVQFTSESGFQDDALTRNHVPLYVMLPLDTVTMRHTLKRVKALQVGLRALKLIGVDGVMIHIWWGVVQGAGPNSYNWSAYLALLELIKCAGLKVQASVCFHGCSKPAGSGTISLPPWILSIGNLNPDVFYTDKRGARFMDCLSLAVDSLPLFGDRSPIQMYKEFLESFRDTFSHYMGDTIVEVIMGLGPDGELRYPAYPKENAQRRIPGMGEFQCYDKYMQERPGVGEFQCYDKYMRESLRNFAEAHGKPEWGQGVPDDTPSYMQWPNDAGFFHEQYGSWKSPSGQLFLSWYSGELLAHGHRMLSLASSVFQKDRVVVMGKVPGVHWWYKTKSHAAELTAGYYNVDGQDGYDKVALMFSESAAMMVLPCMEMSDKEQPSEAKCSPELLLLQIRKACSRHGVLVAGQNSLPRFDLVAYARMKNSIHRFDYPYIPRLAVFTFLQMGESLFYTEHWRLFVNFVRNINKDAWGGSSGGPRGGGQDKSFWAAISTIISFVLKCNINGILSLSSAVLNSKKKLESLSRMQPAGLQVCCS